MTYIYRLMSQGHMASLQVNKLASTEDSASAKSLTKKSVAIQDNLTAQHCCGEGQETAPGRYKFWEMASIINLATHVQTMALTVHCGPEKGTQVTGICIYQYSRAKAWVGDCVYKQVSSMAYNIKCPQ